MTLISERVMGMMRMLLKNSNPIPPLMRVALLRKVKARTKRARRRAGRKGGRRGI